MSQNRIKHYLEEEQKLPTGPPRDYWWLVATNFAVPITRATARSIERQLLRADPPEWIVFRDLSGSRIRIRAERIERLTESTAEQRRADRVFYRALQQDENEDPPSDGTDL